MHYINSLLPMPLHRRFPNIGTLSFRKYNHCDIYHCSYALRLRYSATNAILKFESICILIATHFIKLISFCSIKLIETVLRQTSHVTHISNDPSTKKVLYGRLATCGSTQASNILNLCQTVKCILCGCEMASCDWEALAASRVDGRKHTPSALENLRVLASGT